MRQLVSAGSLPSIRLDSRHRLVKVRDVERFVAGRDAMKAAEQAKD
jgi:hypothetical protein